MNGKKKKIMLVGGISYLSVLTLAVSSVTVAKFVARAKTNQSAYGLGGERMVSLFFNANIWKQGKDSSGNVVDANYYIYVWHSEYAESTRTTLIPSAHVTPTISGTAMDLYVFEFDSTKLDSFLFLRWNPEVVPSADLTSEGKWNQTEDQTYTYDETHSAYYNYYCIDDWGTGDPATAAPTKNIIIKNGSTLSWAY